MRRPLRPNRTLYDLHADRRGQVTLEWALILAVVALPMYFLFRMCLDLLVAKYRMMMFLNSMPFP